MISFYSYTGTNTEHYLLTFLALSEKVKTKAEEELQENPLHIKFPPVGLKSCCQDHLPPPGLWWHHSLLPGVLATPARHGQQPHESGAQGAVFLTHLGSEKKSELQ